MRKFLKDVKIVGATLASREGQLIRYCLDDLVQYCDKILVVLDNFDEETEKIVLNYKERYKDLFLIKYSYIESCSSCGKGNKRRLYHKQHLIRQRVLDELEIIDSAMGIDILLWPDGDEIFTNKIPVVLISFWESDKKVLALRPVTIFDGFNLIRDKTLFPHCHIFKYTPEMYAEKPLRSKLFYQPFKESDRVAIEYVSIHLTLLTEDSRRRREEYAGKNLESLNYKLWKTDDDIRQMSPSNIKNIINKKHDFLVKDYLKEKYGISKL